MKKLFTFFVLSVFFVSTVFAVKKCVFIVAANATADQIIIDHLNDNGFEVTVSVASNTVPAGDYELAVLSETIGSTTNTWAAFRSAPLPFVALKTFAIRGHNNALKWITSSSTGTDYANTTDITVTTANETHPIMAGITTNPQFLFSTVETVSGSATAVNALQWLNFTMPVGATVLTTVTKGLGTAYTVEGALPQSVAFERATAMNGTTLINRAVVAGFNFNANAQLTPNALKLIKQACDWVAALGVATPNAIHSVKADVLKKYGTELFNPTGLEVELYNALGVRVYSSKSMNINMASLSKGIYVAKTSAGVLKFTL